MDDASERSIEEDMLDQFNYFDDEDEELIDRREPAPLDAFDLVDEEPGEDVRNPHSLRTMIRCSQESPCTTAFVPVHSI